jgi:hypothetical protein
MVKVTNGRAHCKKKNTLLINNIKQDLPNHDNKFSGVLKHF